ncbi:MAG: DNA polymerase Y family protein [Myxococcota bacterium]
MERVACLLIPDLPLAAALREDPELRGKPLAIVEAQPRGRTQSPPIVAGWMRGMTVTQARAVEPDLKVRVLSLEGIRSAEQALLDVASSVTPRVEEARNGVVFLDLDGTEALFPSERGLLTALEARLTDVGLEQARLGIGPTRTVAELAARHRGGGRIVKPEEVATFLSPLPLDLLDPPEEEVDRLWRWGVRTLGELAQLPRAPLGARLGEEGVKLARRACGEDLAPFRPTPPKPRFEEGAESEYGMDNLEALAFLLRGVLDRLTRRLRLRGLAARKLRLELVLESGRGHARDLELAAPTLEVQVLISLARLALERDPPPEPVERVRAIATPGDLEAIQLDFFLPPLPAPAELALTVARLEALCGPGQIGAPGVRDTHQLDAAYVESFVLERRAAARAPGPAGLAPGPTGMMALRVLRPPRAVQVRGEDSPEYVIPTATAPDGARVLRSAGPWRLFGEWWGESRFARDYYDVELSDGGVYRLYRNMEDESWYIDGIYD